MASTLANEGDLFRVYGKDFLCIRHDSEQKYGSRENNSYERTQAPPHHLDRCGFSER